MAQIFPIDFDEKLTMAQDDYILFSDSEDWNKIKKAQYKNLKWEKGDPWTPWQDWEDGAAATITVWSTTTGTPWSSASVTNSGTASAAVLDFTIPQWAKWEPWEDGQDWADGAAATITVGTTTTLPAWSSATVTNVWTSQDAILNFGIPKGDAWPWSWDVNWPASSTDWHLAVFDGATGKIIKDWWAMPTIPTKVSDLVNDSGYLTSSTWVTSVNGKTWWAVTVETPNTKTFYLSSTSDLTTAQAAYDWYAAGKNPIIVYNDIAHILKNKSSTVIEFWSTRISTYDYNSYTQQTIYYVNFTLSSDTVTAITQGITNTWFNFLKPWVDYSTPYTPTYPWSPATKKYVDDKKSTISVTLTAIGWSSNSQTVSATGVTASNTVIVSPAPSSIADYTAWWVYCSAQGTDSLTFTCDTDPSNDITVNVVILS